VWVNGKKIEKVRVLLEPSEFLAFKNNFEIFSDGNP